MMLYYYLRNISFWGELLPRRSTLHHTLSMTHIDLLQLLDQTPIEGIILLTQLLTPFQALDLHLQQSNLLLFLCQRYVGLTKGRQLCLR